MRNEKELFTQNGLWQQTGKDVLERLWDMGNVRDCPKCTVLIHAKEPVQHIYIQLSGKSMIYNLTYAGKRKIIFIFGSGSLLNEHTIVLRESSVYCETIEKSRILQIPVNGFIKCMQEDFSLVKSVMEMQERKIWRMGHQLKNTMGSIYLERKLAAKLWKLSRDFGIIKEEGIEIDIDLTITFLADMMGTTRETVSRLCSTLSDAGMIRIKRPRITVINPELLSCFYKTGEIIQKNQ